MADYYVRKITEIILETPTNGEELAKAFAAAIAAFGTCQISPEGITVEVVKNEIVLRIEEPSESGDA